MVTDQEALEKAVTDNPYSEDDCLILSDWYEENGQDEKASEMREHVGNIRKLPGKVVSALKRAKEHGVSDTEITKWLEVWNEHNGLDRNWDYMWLAHLIG